MLAAWEIDLASGAVTWSDAHLALANRPATPTGRMSLEDWRRWIALLDRPAMDAALARVANGEPFQMTWRPAGAFVMPRWLHSLGCRMPMRGGARRRLAGITIDISDHVAAAASHEPPTAPWVLARSAGEAGGELELPLDEVAGRAAIVCHGAPEAVQEAAVAIGAATVRGRSIARRLSTLASEGVAATMIRPAAYAAASPARLLVVDDDPAVLEAVAALLEEHGHEVMRAGDPPTALALLCGAAPVDLLLTDFLLPGLTGAELIDAARRLRPGLPALVLTGHGGPFDLPAQERFDALGVAVLRKPVPGDELAAQILGVLSAPPGQRPGAPHA
jgi:CheY-like chemotaxis protein